MLDGKQLVYYTSCMKTKMKTIGSFEAKTHLSELIETVQKGNEFVITKRGKPVARLVPYTDYEAEYVIEDIIGQFDSIRKSVKGKTDIKEYINKGRKY